MFKIKILNTTYKKYLENRKKKLGTLLRVAGVEKCVPTK